MVHCYGNSIKLIQSLVLGSIVLLTEVALELGKDRDRKSFEAHDRKSPDSFEETVDRNIDVKGVSGRNSERKEESCREIYHLREYIYCNEQNVAGNMHVKGAFSEISDGDVKKVVGN